jgi:hypothetical protein
MWAKTDEGDQKCSGAHVHRYSLNVVCLCDHYTILRHDNYCYGQISV